MLSTLIRLPLVVLLAESVAACDTTGQDTPKAAQRDVYNSLEDCMADWGDTELCEREIKEAREHAQKMAAAQAKASGGAMPVFLPIFMGPTYYGDDRRAVSSSGTAVTPKTTSSARTANFTPAIGGGRVISYTPPNHTATTNTLSRAAGISASTSRGGIGATGSSTSPLAAT